MFHTYGCALLHGYVEVTTSTPTTNRCVHWLFLTLTQNNMFSMKCAYTRAQSVAKLLTLQNTHKITFYFLLLLFLSNYCFFFQIFSLLEISVYNIQCKSITMLTGVTTTWFAFLLSHAQARTKTQNNAASLAIHIYTHNDNTNIIIEYKKKYILSCFNI